MIYDRTGPPSHRHRAGALREVPPAAYDPDGGVYRYALGVNVHRQATPRLFVRVQSVSAFLTGELADSPPVSELGDDVKCRGGVTPGYPFGG